MASINTIVKRKQYLWLGIVVVGTASAIGGALYLSDVDMSGNGETVAEQEPVPDMTGVVDTTFDDKVRQHATTEMQVTAAQMHQQHHVVWSDGRSCDDGADRWSGVVCRKIITPFLARGFFPGILRLSSGCAGRSGAVTGVVSLTARG